MTSHDNVVHFPETPRKGQDRRRSGNGNGTTKEQRSKQQRNSGATPDQVQSKLDRMINDLCAKMYQHEYREKYPSRTAFCLEYGDIAVNRRRVMDPEDRAIMLDGLLRHAEESGRVEIISAGRREFRVRLSDAERETQKRVAHKSGQKRDKYWDRRPVQRSGQVRATGTR